MAKRVLRRDTELDSKLDSNERMTWIEEGGIDLRAERQRTAKPAKPPAAPKAKPRPAAKALPKRKPKPKPKLKAKAKPRAKPKAKAKRKPRRMPKAARKRKSTSRRR